MAIYRAKELQVATAIADEDPEIRLRNNFQSKVALLDSIVVHYYLGNYPLNYPNPSPFPGPLDGPL